MTTRSNNSQTPADFVNEARGAVFPLGVGVSLLRDKLTHTRHIERPVVPMLRTTDIAHSALIAGIRSRVPSVPGGRDTLGKYIAISRDSREPVGATDGESRASYQLIPERRQTIALTALLPGDSWSHHGSKLSRLACRWTMASCQPPKSALVFAPKPPIYQLLPIMLDNVVTIDVFWRHVYSRTW